MTVDAVLAAARALVFVRESPRNSNDGPGVREMLATVGLKPGAPWCAAFVAYVGRAACGAGWALPLTGGCQALFEAASKKGMVKSAPVKGDVFLIWHKDLGRFAHTGFVSDVLPGGACLTLEGNTNDGGSRDGWGVFQRQRKFGTRDRFIRWVT